jgi:hypothetical protein
MRSHPAETYEIYMEAELAAARIYMGSVHFIAPIVLRAKTRQA